MHDTFLSWCSVRLYPPEQAPDQVELGGLIGMGISTVLQTHFRWILYYKNFSLTRIGYQYPVKWTHTLLASGNMDNLYLIPFVLICYDYFHQSRRQYFWKMWSPPQPYGLKIHISTHVIYCYTFVIIQIYHSEFIMWLNKPFHTLH